MWRKLLEEGAIEWNDVANKPSTFPPKSHLHDDQYAFKDFKYLDMKFDLHSVIEQIVVNLEKEHSFKLYE